MNVIKTELGLKYQKVRSHTEYLCQPLKVEDYVLQPEEFVSPPKWHLGHTTWFFEEFILTQQSDYKRFDEDFAYIFNSYYESVGKRVLRAKRGLMSRPEVDELYAYRAYVDQHLLHYLEKGLSDELLDVLSLGLHHEQQHQELLITDLKYILGHQVLFPVYGKVDEYHPISESGWSSIEEGVYEVGFRGEGFSFDNEHGRHKVYLQEAFISNALVSNGDYLEFIEAKGYEDFRFWHSAGWDWVNENKINAPLYWHQKEGRWYNYELDGFKPIDLNAPLKHISFYEASAYAAWKGMRLPTEFEWEVAQSKFNWGDRWEWTNSAYLPYPGFKTAEGAIGEYNGKFMVNQMVLRGASVATSNDHSRPTYRNFFHPHERWQFTGIRLAKDVE